MAQLTKEEILERLSYLDTNKLEKLLSYSENIIIPEEDLLVNVTMQQLMNKGLQLADTHFPQWTDRGFADFGRFLLELFALFSEKDFYYINGFANENLLSRMSIYSDAFMRTVELGYYPNVSRSSKGTFKFTVGALVTDFTIPRGGLIMDVVGTKFSFVNLEPIVITASGVPQEITVELNEGRLLTESFQFNGFSVYVSKENIDTETLVLTSEELTWTRTRTFGQSLVSSRHYVAIPEENGSIRVFFGDGKYGKRPEFNQEISINYLKCSTTDADNLSGACAFNKFPTDLVLSNPLLVGTTRGGQAPDTLSDLKNNARNYFESRYTLNNKFAVKKWLLSQYDVKRAYVNIVNNQVYFRIVTTAPDAIEYDTAVLIRERMQPLVTGGYYAQVENTVYVPITEVNLVVYVLEGFNNPITLARIRNLVSDYTNPYVSADYGKSFSKVELEVLIKSKVEGVQNVVFTSINGDSLDIPVGAGAIMQKVADSGINVNLQTAI